MPKLKAKMQTAENVQKVALFTFDMVTHLASQQNLTCQCGMKWPQCLIHPYFRLILALEQLANLSPVFSLPIRISPV
jgi:hypothetical protein